MAKLLNNVIGVDVGQHTLKAIHVIRRGRPVISGYGIRTVESTQLDQDALSHHLKLLLADVGGGARAHAVVLSGKDAVLRIIDQPQTPISILRNALKINGSMVLHQELPNYIFDCAAVETSKETSANRNCKYLVAGLPRDHVNLMVSTFARMRLPLHMITLPGVCLINAFEVCRPEVFKESTFMLLDIGHEHSLVVGGCRGVLSMIRVIDYGGRNLMADLSMNGVAADAEAVQMLLDQGDAGMAEAVRMSMSQICREIVNSIGFFEGQLDKGIDRLYLSGGALRSDLVMQVLSDELNLPGEPWDLQDQCEIGLSAAQRKNLNADARSLTVAFGAAMGAMSTTVL